MGSTAEELDHKTVTMLKALVMDAVIKAKSGHTGGAFSSMDFAYLLYSEFMRFDPKDPHWPARDRFILSAGHESMLQYALLHLMDWLPLDEIKKFRQLHSKTPGHPENTITPGVECTTGPLGQGVAMSVGFAIAAQFQREHLDAKLFDQHIYALCGDGCMQEDVTLGAASLAGHLGLGNLTWFYDRNAQQISGEISRSTSDDEEKIFSGFGWETLAIDGHDHAAIRKALTRARAPRQKPLLIIAKTIIGKGLFSMEADHEAHGVISAEEGVKTKAKWGINPAEFHIDGDLKAHFQRRFPSLRKDADTWRASVADRRKANADFDRLYRVSLEQFVPPGTPKPAWKAGSSVATRNAFGDVLTAWADALPHLMGGSADLEPSNMTGPFAEKVHDLSREYRKGRNIAFGVREFPMSAITNGMALHGGVIPFDATFLSFADYSRPALRLGAIQRVRVIHEFTHDSFYLGEDGPTHQPIEHLAALRAIPHFYVMRPADAQETEVLMRKALALKAPSAICLSRQKLPLLSLSAAQIEDAAKGGYVVHDTPGADLLMIATGSEVSLALAAATQIKNAKIRVVSLPSWELFFEQPQSYRDTIIPPAVTRRVTIEAGSTFGWRTFAGDRGLMIGRDDFGDSAPMEALAEAYGFTPAKVVAAVEAYLAGSR